MTNSHTHRCLISQALTKHDKEDDPACNDDIDARTTVQLVKHDGRGLGARRVVVHGGFPSQPHAGGDNAADG